MTLPTVGGPLVWAFVAFATVLHVLEEYLEVRQLRKNRESKVPAELEGTVDVAKFLESQAYQKDKRIFGFARDTVNFIYDKVQLFIITPYCWQVATGYFGAGLEKEYSTTLFWLFLLQWVDKPISIPFQLYSHFVVEEKHGFNKMTMKLYFMDLVKSELLTYVFGGLLIPLLIWIVHWAGESFYLYLWGFCQALMLAMMWIYPNIIQPIFNKFEPLKDDDLRIKIEALAAEVSFPLTKLFQIDGSKRSAHSNAYFFGFWKYKRIVLYDTLLHLKQEDILAILCHELGHWKFGHTLFNLIISSTHIFVLFYLYGVVMYSGETSQAIIRQFGYGDSQAVMVSLMVFMMLYSPTEQLISLCMTMLSRHFEFQADSFAVKMGRGPALGSGLLQIHEENKGDLNPDPWYSWYHFSHPPLVERLRELRRQEAELKKKDK
jgi:STE24 endopeptidase|mmetsp:Transcript_17300/g.51917  ORF Transcript_17300/g.51917 Transcript_17300/m.51917 type:complete len:433 (-) Transcript_17300:85-1383(-)